MPGFASRRGFLRGAGAVAVTGIAGCAADLGRPGPHRRVRSPAHQVSGSFRSRYTGTEMGWTIAMPGRARPAAIVYCLHAKGADHRMAFDSIRVPDVAASLGLPFVVAAVDGGHDSYWHRRSDGTDALAMLLREFLPLVRTRTGPLPQALMGWSMGGYGALLAAERASGQFMAVSPCSPALWLAPGDTAPGAFDSPADFYAHDVLRGVRRLRALSPAVTCGTADPFYPAARHLTGLMTFPHQARFAPGGHDAAFWRQAAPWQLSAIGRALRRLRPGRRA